MSTEAAPSEIDMPGLESAISQSQGTIGMSASAVPPPAAPAAPVAEKPTAEPVVVKPADTTPKKPWEKLEGEKKEEAQPEKDKKPEGEKPADDDVPEPPNLNKEQKDKFIAHRRAHNELKRQVPELQKQLEEARKQIEQAKATAKPDEATLAELEELRTYRAAREVEATPEWKSTISDPISVLLGSLADIASVAKVDPAKLEAATDEPVTWKRSLAIKKVFEEAEEAVPAELAAAALNESEKLWTVYTKASEMKAKAQELWQGLQNKGSVEAQKLKEAEEQQYQQHHDSIYDQLKAKLPTVFSDEQVAKAVKEVRPAADPDDKAYQAMSSELLPVVTDKLHAALAEIERLKKSEKALIGARPGLGSPSLNGTRKPGADDGEMDEGAFNDALMASRVGR